MHSYFKRFRPSTSKLSMRALSSAVLLTAGSAFAGQANGVIDQTNHIGYTFVDAISSATLNVFGSARADLGFSPTVITTSDGFWTVTVSPFISETIDDVVSLNVAMTHLAMPHGSIDGTAETFSESFSWRADNYADGSVNEVIGNRSRDHGQHDDLFKNFSFTATKATKNLVEDEFTSWHFTMHAQHLPEPGTYAMLLTGLAALGALVRRRRGSGA